MKYYIVLEYKKDYYKLFLLGYTSDGGFFVKDLVNDGKKYLIAKMLIPSPDRRKFGKYAIPIEKGKYWVTTNSPKLTHHVDGTVQISGTGIMSGFYKFFKGHKGVSTQSMNLYKNDNDGGPVFIFHTTNLPITKNKGKNQILIKKSDQLIDPYYKPLDENDYAFTLEFFYFPQGVVARYLNPSNMTILLQHPNYGIISLRYVPAPECSPGGIGIFTRIVSMGDTENQFFFSLNGGASADLEGGEFEHISIIYPFEKDRTGKQKIKKLDFAGFNKFKAILDSIIYKIKSRF